MQTRPWVGVHPNCLELLIVGARAVRPKDVFESAIGALSLTVGLRVVSRGDVELDAEELHERLPEGGLEAWITVRDDGVGDTMKGDDLEEELGCS